MIKGSKECYTGSFELLDAIRAALKQQECITEPKNANESNKKTESQTTTTDEESEKQRRKMP